MSDVSYICFIITIYIDYISKETLSIYSFLYSGHQYLLRQHQGSLLPMRMSNSVHTGVNNTHWALRARQIWCWALYMHFLIQLESNTMIHDNIILFILYLRNLKSYIENKWSAPDYIDCELWSWGLPPGSEIQELHVLHASLV